jgi:uncharacterized lipoprotein YmbA
LILGSCASPAVILYTLAASAPSGSQRPFGQHPVVIVVDRVALPDELDSQDILIRKGSVLERSHTGRWASRLSLGITDLVTDRLAKSRPDALVTNQPQTTTPAYTIRINISQLDLVMDAAPPGGTATLEADWMIVAQNPAVPVQRDRTRVQLAGPVGTDHDVVALMAATVIRLAAAIDLRRMP